MSQRRATGVFTVVTVRDGDDGFNTAVVQLYKRKMGSLPAPDNNERPQINLWYKFSTQKLYTDAACTTEFTTSTTGGNGWGMGIPAAEDGKKIYITCATAYARGDVDKIEVDSTKTPPVNEWSTPVVYTENGSTAATVVIYKRAASQPLDTPTKDAPTDGAVYTFADNSLVAASGGSLNGWSTAFPATNGQPCWRRQATALSNTGTDTIDAGEWSEAVKEVEDGAAGKNSVRLALDNEHEDFLYSDAGLVSPANGATSRIHLYDGNTEKTSELTIGTGGTLTIYSTSGVPTSGTGAPTITGSAQTGYTLNIPALSAASAKVVVKAEYKGDAYYADFTANKTSQDKYDIFVEPSSIAYNPASYSAQTQKRIRVYALLTNLKGESSQAVIQSGEVSGLRLYARYKASSAGSTTDWHQVTTSELNDNITKFYIDVTPDIASWNDGIYLELRKYGAGNAYDVKDFETVEIAKSVNGAGQPSYIQTQEAWSNEAETASETTCPTDCIEDETHTYWYDSTPSNPSGRAYLWRRSRKMVLQSDGSYAAATGTDGQWKYSRLSGTNGTSIKTKGTIAVAVVSGGTLPTAGMSSGDLGIKQGDSTPWIFNGTSWSQNGMSAAADGDSYVVSKDCTVDLDGDGTATNIKGHLVMWSVEASKWIDLGQFKGENGITYYTHIAWASSVDTSDPWSSALPEGQISMPTVNSASDVTGGSITPAADGSKPWMGVLINTSSGADTTHWHYYTWSYARGPQGNPGKSVYSLQCSVATVKMTKNYAGTVAASPSTFKLTLQYEGTAQGSVPSGYYLYYRRTSGGSWSSFSGGLNTNIDVLGASYLNDGAYTMLEFCLSTASSHASVSNSNIISSASLTAVWEFQRMLVPAGTYTSKEYTRTWNTTPLVLEPGSNTYWFLIADSNNTGTSQSPNYISPSDSAHRTGIWQQASEFEVVLTKMLFAEFARVGSAIFYGDHMFSQYLANELTMFSGTYSRSSLSYAMVSGQTSMPVVAGTQYKIRVTCRHNSSYTSSPLMAAVYYLKAEYDDTTDWTNHAVGGAEKISTMNNTEATYDIDFTAEYTGYVRIYAYGYGTVTKIVASVSATYEKISPMFMNTDKVPLLETWQADTQSTSYVNVVNIPIPIVSGRKYKLTFKGFVNGGKGYVAMCYNGSARHEKTFTNTAYADIEHEFTASYTGEAYVRFKVSYASYRVTVKSMYIECVDPFIPKVEVNWLTGYAHFGGDSVRFNPDGSGHLAGRNIQWDKGGNTEFKGTVRSTNLYHSVVIHNEESLAYCTQAFISYLESEGLSQYIPNFNVGQYYTESEVRALSNNQVGIGADGMVKCTGPADIIVVSHGANDNYQDTIILPLADDYTGKVVEIIDTRYTPPSGTTYVGRLSVKQADDAAKMKNSFIDNQGHGSVILNGNSDHEGGTYRLYSWKSGSTSYWVKMSTRGET